MIEARALLATASKLLESEPSEVDVRRSVSTAYYALFHHVCWHFSDIILQPQSGAYERARLQAYRYLDHGVAKVRCNEATAQAKGFPAGIVEFAEASLHLTFATP